MKKRIIKLMQSVIRNTGGPSREATSARRIVIISFSALATALAVTSGLLAQRVPTASINDTDEVDVAIEEALRSVLSTPPYPANEEDLEGAVKARFAAMNPELALQELRKDPAFVEAEAVALATIADPGKPQADLLQDEKASRELIESVQALTRGVAEANAKYMEALAATLSTMRDSREVDAELMANPEWRRQREEAVQARLPYQQAGSSAE